MMTVTAEGNMLKRTGITLESKVMAFQGGRVKDRAQSETLTSTRDTAQTEVQQLRHSVDCFELLRRDVNSAITRRHREIREMDRCRATWYRERRDFGFRALFAVRCATQLMIQDACDRADERISG